MGAVNTGPLHRGPEWGFARAELDRDKEMDLEGGFDFDSQIPDAAKLRFKDEKG